MLAEATLATALKDERMALERFAGALRLLAEAQQLTDLSEARIAFARALVRFGDLDGAQAEFERAREALAEMGAGLLLAEVERELLELGRGADPVGPPLSA